MGSGNRTLPQRATINDALFGNPGKQTKSPITGTFANSDLSGTDPTIPFGKELANSLFKGFSSPEGLPPELKKMLMSRGQSQLGASLNQGKQDIAESVAGLGGVPIDAVLSAQNKLRGMYSNNLKQLNEDVAFKDYDVSQANKNNSINNLFQLFGLASNDAGRTDSYNLSKYQIDKENEFDWGDALGGVLGTAGTIGGAGISRKGRNKK